MHADIPAMLAAREHERLKKHARWLVAVDYLKQAERLGLTELVKEKALEILARWKDQDYASSFYREFWQQAFMGDPLAFLSLKSMPNQLQYVACSPFYFGGVGFEGLIQAINLEQHHDAIGRYS